MFGRHVKLERPAARSLERGNVELAVPSFGQVREPLDGDAHIFDAAAMVPPLDDHLSPDLRSIDVDATHRKHFAKVIAISRARGDADLTAVPQNVIGVCLRPHVRRIGEIDRLVCLPGTQQGGVDVDHVLRIPAECYYSALRIGDLGFERSTTEEIVIEFTHVMPSNFDGGTKARAQVSGVDAT